MLWFAHGIVDVADKEGKYTLEATYSLFVITTKILTTLKMKISSSLDECISMLFFRTENGLKESRDLSL